MTESIYMSIQWSTVKGMKIMTKNSSGTLVPLNKDQVELQIIYHTGAESSVILERIELKGLIANLTEIYLDTYTKNE